MLEDFEQHENYQVPPMASSPPVNPLAQYFRAPGVTVNLPTGGSVEVFPMTAADEILLKSPDALMSGAAIDGMIRSCIPKVEKPQDVVLPDLEVMLLGIRAATYGDRLELESKCSHCGHEHEIGVSLASVMATSKPVPPTVNVETADGLTFVLRPYTMGLATAAANVVFSETRKIQAAVAGGEQDNIDTANSNAITAIGSATQDGIARSITAVILPNGQSISEYMHIRELMANYSAAHTKKLETAIADMNGRGLDKNVKVSCVGCKKDFAIEIDLDPSSFFVNAS